MSAEDFLWLSCGCCVMGGLVWDYCDYHDENQPLFGDPLYLYLLNRDMKVE